MDIRSVESAGLARGAGGYIVRKGKKGFFSFRRFEGFTLSWNFFSGFSSVS